MNEGLTKKNSYKAASSYEALVLEYICSNLKKKQFKSIFNYFVNRNIKLITHFGKVIKLQKKDNILDIGSGYLGNLNIYKFFKKKTVSIIEIEKEFISNCKLILKKIPLSVNFFNSNLASFKTRKKFNLVICSKFLNIYNEAYQLRFLNKISKISKKYILLIVMKEKSFINIIFKILNKIQLIRIFLLIFMKILGFVKFFDLLILLNFKKIQIMNLIFFLKSLLSNKFSVQRYVFAPQFYVEALEKNNFSLTNSFSDNTYKFLVFKKD